MVNYVVGYFKDWEAFEKGKRVLHYEPFWQLHPSEFADKVKDLANKFEGVDVYLWINDPYILETVPANQVIVLNGDKSARLDKHPKYERWKDEMSSGEMWSLFGEKWVE